MFKWFIFGVFIEFVLLGIVITVLYFYAKSQEDKIYALAKGKSDKIQQNLQAESTTQNTQFETKLRANINTQTSQLIQQEKDRYEKIKADMLAKYKTLGETSKNQITDYAKAQGEKAKTELMDEFTKKYDNQAFQDSVIAEIRPTIVQQVKDSAYKELGPFIGGIGKLIFK